MVHHAYAAVRHSSTGTTIKGCTCPTPLQIETTRSLLVICYWSGVLLLLPGSTDAASRAMSCSVAGRAMVRTATASIVAFILVSAARRAASSAVTPDGGGGVSCTDERNQHTQATTTRGGKRRQGSTHSYMEILGSASRLIDDVDTHPKPSRASMSMNAA